MAIGDDGKAPLYAGSGRPAESPHDARPLRPVRLRAAAPARVRTDSEAAHEELATPNRARVRIRQRAAHPRGRRRLDLRALARQLLSRRACRTSRSWPTPAASSPPSRSTAPTTAPSSRPSSPRGATRRRTTSCFRSRPPASPPTASSWPRRGESIERFVGSGIAELGAKLGPLVWQFMPTKRFEPDDFEAFLALLARSASMAGRCAMCSTCATRASRRRTIWRWRAAIGCTTVHTDAPQFPAIVDAQQRPGVHPADAQRSGLRRAAIAAGAARRMGPRRPRLDRTRARRTRSSSISSMAPRSARPPPRSSSSAAFPDRWPITCATAGFAAPESRAAVGTGLQPVSFQAVMLRAVHECQMQRLYR